MRSGVVLRPDKLQRENARHRFTIDRQVSRFITLATDTAFVGAKRAKLHPGE